VDSHAPSIDRLRAVVAQRGLSPRVQAMVGDIAHLSLPPASFDLVWSEGALYNVGIPQALRICHDLLRPGGYLVFTDAVWRTDDPPPEVKAGFDREYPTMGRVGDVLAAITAARLDLVGHFTLPDDAWWVDFYTPMQRRVDELRLRYAQDAAALAALDEIAREPEMHRRFGDSYAYEFYVARRR
jgi:SAM-dependent methyltransferase